MGLQIKDAISPALAHLARALADPRPVLAAAGEMLVSITKRAFADATLRPLPWKPRKDKKTHPLLRKSGNLWQSINTTKLTKSSVTVGSDKPYAAVQQLGSKPGKKKRGGPIPPRPYFPFLPSGEPTPLAKTRIDSVVRTKVASLLRGGSP